MTGRRSGRGRRVGTLIVLLGTAPWLVSQAAEPNKSDPRPEQTPSQPPVSDYVRAAEAARARTLAAGGKSPIVSNDDLPDLYYVDRRRDSAESLLQPTSGDDLSVAVQSTQPRESEEIRPATQSPEVAPAEEPEKALKPVKMSRERRAEISRWKQRMAEAEKNRRNAEQQVEQIAREQGDPGASSPGAPLDSRLKEARRKLTEANSLIQRLQRQDPNR